MGVGAQASKLYYFMYQLTSPQSVSFHCTHSGLLQDCVWTGFKDSLQAEFETIIFSLLMIIWQVTLHV